MAKKNSKNHKQKERKGRKKAKSFDEIFSSKMDKKKELKRKEKLKIFRKVRGRMFLGKAGDLLLKLLESDDKSKDYLYGLSKQLDSTYAHFYKVCKRLEKLGLVVRKKKKKNRKKIVSLTKKGEEFAKLLRKINLKTIEFCEEKLGL